MAARTNYLVAVKDLIRHVDHVEIPVYLCDSIMTPAEYGDLFTGASLGNVAKVPCSAMKPPHLLVPKEIAKSPKEVAKYAEVLETCIKNAYKPDEFLARCRDEGLNITATDAHISLYKELVRLDKENKNGIWARIIKNNFAPLFVGRVDYVAGNPPWIFWNNLPLDYRQDVRRIMGEKYGLISTKASKMERLGQTGKDISMLFVYVACDQYLSPAGMLGFVITQTIFQSTAGAEFRRFALPGGTPLGVREVNDWVAVRPFKAAANRTAVVVIARGERTEHPVSYNVYKPVEEFDVDDASLDEILRACITTAKSALPSTNEATSPWSITDPGQAVVAARPSGASVASTYRARLGVKTGAEGVFRVKGLNDVSETHVLGENDISRSKRDVPVVKGHVEKSLLFTFASGSSTRRWLCTAAGYYIVPHTLSTGMAAIPETDMKHTYRGAWEFLRKFETILESRAIHKLWGSGGPFYSLYDIGPYTFSPYKVVWKRVSKTFEAAVASIADDPCLGKKLIIPNESLMCVHLEDEDEAFYLCGFLNSPSVSSRINQTITMQVHSEILNVANVPRFNPKDHQHAKIQALARNAHTAAKAGDEKAIAEIERELDRICKGLAQASTT